MQLEFTHFSKHPELVYGFSEKKDGSMRLGDNEKIFQQNRKRREKYFAKFGTTLSQIAQANLVHGDNIAKIGQDQAGKIIPETDGLITNTPNIFLALTGADCFPVYFYDPRSKVVGLVHVGWKGAVRNIVGQSVKSLIKNFDIKASDLLVGIGSGIRECHFEIKEENLHFYKDYSDQVVRRNDQIFIDLAGIIKQQLLETGTKKKNIEDSELCTYCLKNKYFSYRRDKPEIIEAMIAHIGMKGQQASP